MSHSNPDDSDCIIEDPNITCITLDDSQDGEKFVLVEDEETPAAAAPTLPSTSMEQDIEDGEVSEEEEEDEEVKKNVEETVENKDENICEIIFDNQNNFKKFGFIIINTLKEKLNEVDNGTSSIEIFTKQDNETVTLTVKHVHNNDVEDIPMPPSLKSPSPAKEEPKAFEKELSPDLSGLSELFMIDTEPAAKIDSVKVPSYKRAIKDALLDEDAAALKKAKLEEDVFKRTKTNTCFNCGDSGHSIKDCPKPHNAKRIKNARRTCYKAERYHVDVEQRFAHLKPGNVSDKLREALGLRKGQLPFFFYRMRVLGYPPGWLEDAKVEHSGITLFNSDGSKILHSDEDEGEVDTTSHKYNISKIIEFPGFNQDPGEQFYDDYKYHNVPPFDRNQMKEEFVKTLGDNVLKAYKRKKLKEFPNATADESVNVTTQETADMEIEDPELSTVGNVEFTRPPPPTESPPDTEDEAQPPPPPTTPPPTCETPTNHNENSLSNLSSASPSLLELEKQKQQLLQELQANTSVIEIEDSLIDEIIALDESSNNDDDNNATETKQQDMDLPASPTENPNKNLDNQSEPSSTANNITADIIKESFMGTPVLKFSPYDNLPNGENFKVGVSDVINFENLPDSTGKYEQMKQVIKKVRNVIHKLHSEE